MLCMRLNNVYIEILILWLVLHYLKKGMDSCCFEVDEGSGCKFVGWSGYSR